MSDPHVTGHQVQRAEELVSWTGRERLRFLWYRLRLTVQEMNYSTRRLVELQMRLPDNRCVPAPPRHQERAFVRGAVRLAGDGENSQPER